MSGTYPRLNKESLLKAYKENRLWFGKSGENVPRLKKYLNEVKQGVISNSIFLSNEVGSTQLAKETLKNILSKNIFETPKPVDLIKKLIMLNTDKNGIVLDFMAGSGTTGQATLSLNKDDNGNRKFILCTNNEGNICTEVCHPRIEKVIKGYKTSKNKKIDGLNGNLKYYKTSFVKNTISRDEMKTKITEQCTEMLCLREGIFEEVKSLKSYKIFKQNHKVMAVYYALEQDKIDSLKKSLDKIEGDKILYCFTLDYLGLNKEDFIGWDDVRLEPIPQKILDVYKDIYEY